MRFDTEHGIQALYEIAQGQYTEHWFSTVRRDFVADSWLINRKQEFQLDTTLVTNSSLDSHANIRAAKRT